MSRIIQVWELNSEQQDDLWVYDKCPNCGAKMIEKDMTADLAYWRCRYCDTEYICE